MRKSLFGVARVFCLGGMPAEVKVALEAEYKQVEVFELPWDAQSPLSPAAQAAQLYLAFENAGGLQPFGDRILFVPASVSALIQFAVQVSQGDYGVPYILPSDRIVDGQPLPISEPDEIRRALRDLRAMGDL